MLECILDSRERSLWEDLEDNPLPIPTRLSMLPLGDVVIQVKKDEANEILLMIERKSVRDLVQSLKDGRYHDQRKRWLEFRTQSPNSFVSLWVEGDLLAADMDNIVKSSLVNSLFRLQSKYKIIIHHVRTRDAFLKSLRMVIDKFSKDPYHLVPHEIMATTTAVNMNQYRKSAQSQEQYWQSCLTLVPGVSPQIALKIQSIFPTLICLVDALNNNPRHTLEHISEIKISEKRKLGKKLAEKILLHLDPSLSFLDQTK